ncbi:MAG: class I SAM-dependent methyltransferase [Tannerella sp.]|nr:class I SAM-dependent methyltransferase [Tannerella sp.]
MEIDALYHVRFQYREIENKRKLWKILCKHYFSKYINKNDCVLDLAAGYCEFINNIEAAEKIAVDINPDIMNHAAPGVRVVKAKSSQMDKIKPNSVNVVFISNFFEHISKEEIVLTLNECKRILTGGGKIIILQPNIKYVGAAYWDFFDHHTPLTDKSIKEALELTGFHVDKTISKSLPYTTKSKIPQLSWLVKLYIYMPIAWKIMGKQSLVIAKKK